MLVIDLETKCVKYNDSVIKNCRRVSICGEYTKEETNGKITVSGSYIATVLTYFNVYVIHNHKKKGITKGELTICYKDYVDEAKAIYMLMNFEILNVSLDCAWPITGSKNGIYVNGIIFVEPHNINSEVINLEGSK